jgi:hypothetical protein
VDEEIINKRKTETKNKWTRISFSAFTTHGVDVKIFIPLQPSQPIPKERERERERKIRVIKMG